MQICSCMELVPMLTHRPYSWMATHRPALLQNSESLRVLILLAGIRGKRFGNWTNTPGSGTLTSLSDFQVWLGLKNSDDIGTKFDLRADIYKNNQLVVSGQTLCISGITRNPDQSKDTMVSFGTFAPVSFGSTDLLSLKVLTRIGTNPDNTQCGGHFNAVGLRAYFDSVNRPAKFDMTFVSKSVVIFQDDNS